MLLIYRCLFYWYNLFWPISGSSHPEVFWEKGILKICSKFTGEHPCRSVISIKLQSNLSLRTPLGDCFWMCSAKILLSSTNSTWSFGLEKTTLQSGRVFIISCFSSNKLSSICLDVSWVASFVPARVTINVGFFFNIVTTWCFKLDIVAPLKSGTLTSPDFFERWFLSITV